jgi:hypothetical protein
MPTHQLSLDLIHHQANGSVIDQRAADGYINATAMCNAVGKKISHYLENKSTIAFLEELSVDAGIPASILVQTIKGGNTAFQGTWVHPQVAINMAMWLSPEFAVKVSKWIFEWMSGKGGPKAKPTLPIHMQRYMANDSQVPSGHFSILQETGISLFGPLHILGFDIPKGWVPDISVGLKFCAWLRKVHGVNTDSFPKYAHDYLDGRPICYPNAYPDEYLAMYRTWFRTMWLPENGRNYFKTKDPHSLAYLNRMPALSGPTKPLGLPTK